MNWMYRVPLPFMTEGFKSVLDYFPSLKGYTFTSTHQTKPEFLSVIVSHSVPPGLDLHMYPVFFIVKGFAAFPVWTVL